jgi:hypothetical protein
MNNIPNRKNYTETVIVEVKKLNEKDDLIPSLQSEVERLKKENWEMEKIKLHNLSLEGSNKHLEAEINRLNSQLEVADNLYIDEQKQYSKLRELLREVVMRSQLSFPENNQDGEWFNEGLKPELFPRIVKELDLGLGDEFLPVEEKKEDKECECPVVMVSGGPKCLNCGGTV